MATVVPKISGTKFSDVNGFYRVEAQNLGICGSLTEYISGGMPTSSTAYTVTIPVTFANAGNCMGIMVVIYIGGLSTTTDRGFVVNYKNMLVLLGQHEHHKQLPLYN